MASSEVSYSENQLEQMLLPKGASRQEIANQEIAIQYIFAHPEVVNPFAYAKLSARSMPRYFLPVTRKFKVALANLCL
jgi:hypothetical protein